MRTRALSRGTEHEYEDRIVVVRFHLALRATYRKVAENAVITMTTKLRQDDKIGHSVQNGSS
jgi:hypothetical protein